MKKALIILCLMLVLLCSCEREEGFVAPVGAYTVEVSVGEAKYLLNLELHEDRSCIVRFEEGSAMSDWYFTVDPDGKTRCFTSLGVEFEVKHENIDRIFDFVNLSNENIADVSHDTISGRDVSILKLTDGTLIYTDSLSGEPLKLVYDNLTVDIISRPQ